MAEEKTGKRRRLQGSCDSCRKKKGDSAEMPGNQCTNCISLQQDCTHHRSKAPARRGTPPPLGQETAQEHIAAILSTSTVYIPSNDLAVSHQVLVKVAHYARELEATVASLRVELRAFTTQLSHAKLDIPTTPIGTRPILVDDEDPNPNAPVQSAPKEAVYQLYGKSISIHFLIKHIKQMHGNTSYVVGVRRPEFWMPQPWDKLTIESPHQKFPEDDLLKTLVKNYFDQINPILNILHAPTFNESVADGLHLRDRSFGAVLLVVCALGSRYSEDRRVFLVGATSEHSCGWKWDHFLAEHALHQLQLICLAVSYLGGTDISTPSEGFILAGLGLRFAHAAGVHRRSGYTPMDPLTAELYKRVVWLLIISDTLMSSFKGQPGITQSTNFDLDLPLDCDDEYWGVRDAVQPEGKPSAGAFFPVYAQLIMIFGRIQGAVYPLHGQICSEDVVVQLDSALNQWLDMVPEHLKWNPHQESQVGLLSSLYIYCTYYHAQVLIHRPFIPVPGQDIISTTKFPILAICANAARSCGHVLDIQTRRAKPVHNPHVVIALFDCAVVLLINVWAVVGGRKSRGPEDFNLATADVQNYLRVLRLYERRWRSAGRKCDIISAMLNIGKYTASIDTPSTKRARANDDADATAVPPSSGHSSDTTVSVGVVDSSPAPEPISISVTQQMQALERSFQETENLFSLPLRTDELGRLPIYDSFDYQFTDYGLDFQNVEAPPLQPEMFSPAMGGSISLGDGTGNVFAMEGGQPRTLHPDSFGAPPGYQSNVDGLERV
ncbi:fungal-specific transcription factor domain-containing protein [Mycena alexandri]|uniref:Fungal-specific transcription factor domain-containing protein n=1 Tax=Mycena alexandri TaxID=1745969 RepID=A0AAD6TJ89_9AGAR|nr:fungal-specific transcription factor domain-containing protein [Mycena alexandri]